MSAGKRLHFHLDSPIVNQANNDKQQFTHLASGRSSCWGAALCWDAVFIWLLWQVSRPSHTSLAILQPLLMLSGVGRSET